MKIGTSGKLYKLEAIRGFAAVYVVFYHLFASGLNIFNIELSFLFRFGQEAVILFFVLSGFVIFYSFERSNDKSIGLFFRKRFLRIYIPLIFVFVANYFLFCYYNKRFINIDLHNLFGNLFMLQDLHDKKPNVLFKPFLNNLPLWSLSYEWWFYFIFLFVYKKLDNSSIAVYLISLVAAISYVFYPNFINRELMYLALWWIGVDMAKLYLSGKAINFKTLKRPLLFLLLISTILFLNIIFNFKNNKSVAFLSGLSASPWLEFRHFIFTVLVVMAAIIWKKVKWMGFDIIFKPFVYIAPISFGIYISHWFLIYAAHYFDFIENKSIRLVCYVIVCILFSYLIEKVLYPKIHNLLAKKIK